MSRLVYWLDPQTTLASPTLHLGVYQKPCQGIAADTAPILSSATSRRHQVSEMAVAGRSGNVTATGATAGVSGSGPRSAGGGDRQARRDRDARGRRIHREGGICDVDESWASVHLDPRLIAAPASVGAHRERCQPSPAASDRGARALAVADGRGDGALVVRDARLPRSPFPATSWARSRVGRADCRAAMSARSRFTSGSPTWRSRGAALNARSNDSAPAASRARSSRWGCRVSRFNCVGVGERRALSDKHIKSGNVVSATFS
jgi:hypothetical protein